MTGAELSVRWMKRRDLPRVIEIDTQVGIEVGQEEYLLFLRQRNAIGMVAELGDTVAGYMMYELRPRLIALRYFAVDPHCSGRGVGRAMVEALTSKSRFAKQGAIAVSINEYNVEMQMFLKACGFLCVRSERGFFDGADLLEFRLDSQVWTVRS